MPLIGVSVSLGEQTSATPSATATATATATASTPSASTPSAPSAPSAPSVPSVGPARDFAMKAGETVYLNVSDGPRPTAWVAYTVAYTFADGNAALIKEPDCVAYTGQMAIGMNLRRAGSVYGGSTFNA